MPQQNEPAGQWVHLFSSTIRELYIADVIDVLAAPTGSIFRFRYEEDYVASGTRARWIDGSLVGLPVAVHFSLQHPAEYHPAAFIPIRQGKIVSTTVEGGTYVIRFCLGDYLPLSRDAESPADAVHAFTGALGGLLGANHPNNRVHATIGQSPEAAVKPTGNDGVDFETLVRFISPALYFSPRTYFRIAAVVDTGKDEPVKLSKSGSLLLTAGRQYTLQISHYQAEAPTGDVELEVTVPPGLMLHGESVVSFRSRYDVIPVDVFASFRDDQTAGEISIRTLDPARGPTVRLPVTITPATSHSASGPLLAVGGAMALVLAPVLGSDDNVTARAITAIVGTGLVGLGVWIRRAKGLSS